ncbi:hypothetical protein SELMODRAFT_112767 [Selaginella moellendorffii]|uniref:Ubiquinol oxidase n=1 Tax=Selaginella moellendorffii TaxID=88036 RepID=D8SBG7_SELML|nr:hypothetical protein SELMODRAFT_112767 [Selaginella moellendorffii]
MVLTWRAFQPSENRIIEAEGSIDVNKHRNPENFSDQFARLAVMALRFPTDLLFRQRYICRAAMLETISGVPGMVGGMVLHCKSLRRVEHSGGWIKALMEEAENERMHLMTFMELSKPSWQERALVFTAQGMFMNAYFLLYVVSPRFAHRMAGYIREETIQSYTQLINDIDDGKVPNAPAPDLAIDYWRLPMDATLRDVVMVIRADEIHHREINHFAADVYMQGHTLKEAPADMVTMTTSFGEFLTNHSVLISVPFTARSHASTT